MSDTNFRPHRRDLMTGLAAAGSLIATGASAQDVEASSLEIDHISLGVQNLFEGSERLQRETGIPSIQGRWFPDIGMANRYFATGDNTYIEVESVIDPFAIARKNPIAVDTYAQLAGGDAFLGYVLRVKSRAELDRIAKRLGVTVVAAPLGVRVDGVPSVNYVRAPDTPLAWPRGLPNFIFWDGTVTKPVLPGPVKPTGIAWLEVGGTRADMEKWVGDAVSRLPFRYNGKPAGLYAVGIKSRDRIIEVRRTARHLA